MPANLLPEAVDEDAVTVWDKDDGPCLLSIGHARSYPAADCDNAVREEKRVAHARAIESGHEKDDRAEISPSGKSSASTTSASVDEGEGTVWDVQILAERKMADGNSEVFVLWKPSWIPIKDMHSDCPAMRKFSEAPKARFGQASVLGALIIPVEPGTNMARDCAWEDTRHVAEYATGDSSGA